jgi:hypothetical protein
MPEEERTIRKLLGKRQVPYSRMLAARIQSSSGTLDDELDALGYPRYPLRSTKRLAPFGARQPPSARPDNPTVQQGLWCDSAMALERRLEELKAEYTNSYLPSTEGDYKVAFKRWHITVELMVRCLACQHAPLW